MNDNEILSNIVNNYNFNFKVTGSNKSTLSNNILSINMLKGFILNNYTYLISLYYNPPNPTKNSIRRKTIKRSNIYYVK